MTQRLNQYLQNLALEGVRHSEGSFTIDYSRGYRQLSSRLFEDPCAYLIKLAQAALSAHTPRLEVRTVPGILQVCFASDQLQAAQLGQLGEQFHQPLKEQSGDFMGHFLRCLHGAMAAKFRVVLASQDAHQGWVLELSGDRMQRQSIEPVATELCHWVVTFYGAEGRGWKAEQEAVAQRCALSTRPVIWDGKALNPRVPGMVSQPTTPPILLDRLYLSEEPASTLLALPHLTSLPALTYDLGRGYQDYFSRGKTLLQQWRGYHPPRGQAPLFPATRKPDLNILESDWLKELFGLPPNTYALNHGLIRPRRVEGRNNGYHILYVQNPGYTVTDFTVRQARFGRHACPCAQAWVRCPSLPAGPSQIHFVQSQVRLDPVEVALPLAGVQAYVADQEVETDLTGLTPIFNDRVAEVTHWITHDLTKAKKELRQALRWNEKYGVSETWVQELYRVHRLDQD